MKEKCLSSFSILKPNLPVQEFYDKYAEYCKHKGIKSLSKVVISRTLSNELGITSTRPYVGGKQVRAYNITQEELCKKFLNKNWIHESDEMDGVDIPETPASDPKALDQFLNNIHPVSFQSESQPELKKNTPPAPDSSKPVSKKVPPPIPSTPDHLKVSTNSSNTDDKQEPLGIPSPSGTSIESQSIETKTEVKSLEPKPEEEMPPTQSNPPIVQQSIKLKKKPDALIKLENKENRTERKRQNIKRYTLIG